MVSFAAAAASVAVAVAAASVLLRSQRREAHSRRLAHQEGTSGCSPETSMATVFPHLIDFVCGKLMGGHPSGNLLFE